MLVRSAVFMFQTGLISYETVNADGGSLKYAFNPGPRNRTRDAAPLRRQAELAGIQRANILAHQPRDPAIDARIYEISIQLRQLAETRRAHEIRFC